MRNFRWPENGKMVFVICPHCQRVKKLTQWVKISPQSMEQAKKDYLEVDFILEICPDCWGK
jgi:mRNA-degrading endonuclease toxin of MazEF toxin-antitoxin module